MNHITLIISKTMLNDRVKQLVNEIKPIKKGMSGTVHNREYEAKVKEIEAVKAELWLLNNW